MDIRKILDDMQRRGNEAGMDYAKRSMPEAFPTPAGPTDVQASQGLQDLLAGGGVSAPQEAAKMSVEDPTLLAQRKLQADIDSANLASAPSAAHSSTSKMLAHSRSGGHVSPMGEDLPSAAQAASPENELLNAQLERNASNNRAVSSSGMQDIADAMASLGANRKITSGRSAQELLLQNAEQPVKNIHERQQYQNTQMELNTEKERRDPNSDVSKIYRQSLKEMGIDVGEHATAASLEKAIGPIGNIMNAKMAREARADNMKLLTQAKTEAAEAKNDDKFNRYVERQGQNFLKGDSYKALVKSNDALETINSALANPSGIKDVASLYGIVKGLDPDSVVRPGEIELAQQASGLWQNIKVKLSRLGPNPKVVDKKILEQMKAYLQEVRLQKLKQVKRTEDSISKHMSTNYGKHNVEEYLPQVNPMHDTVRAMTGGAQAEPQMEAAQPAQDPQIAAWAAAHKKKDGTPFTYEEANQIIQSRKAKAGIQ